MQQYKKPVPTQEETPPRIIKKHWNDCIKRMSKKDAIVPGSLTRSFEPAPYCKICNRVLPDDVPHCIVTDCPHR